MRNEKDSLNFSISSVGNDEELYLELCEQNNELNLRLDELQKITESFLVPRYNISFTFYNLVEL